MNQLKRQLKSVHEGFTDEFSCEDTHYGLDCLINYGVAVIPGLLDDAECDDVISGMWDFVEQATSYFPPDKQVHRDVEASWGNVHELFVTYGGLQQYWGVAHSKVMWALRQHPKILRVFSKLWHSDDLRVSFEGLAFAPPPESTPKHRGKSTGHVWMHTDQSLRDSSMQCYQSLFTAVDIEDGDATFCFLEGSHHLHAEFAKSLPPPVPADAPFTLRDEQHLRFYLDRGCTFRRIRCPRGSLVLWDSRLIHQGAQPVLGRARPKLQATAFLCYLPAAAAPSSRDLKMYRAQAFDSCRTTSYQPFPLKMHAKQPQYRGNPGLADSIVRITRPPRLTPIGYQIVGFTPDEADFIDVDDYSLDYLVGAALPLTPPGSPCGRGGGREKKEEEEGEGTHTCCP